MSVSASPPLAVSIDPPTESPGTMAGNCLGSGTMMMTAKRTPDVVSDLVTDVTAIWRRKSDTNDRRHKPGAHGGPESGERGSWC